MGVLADTITAFRQAVEVEFPDVPVIPHPLDVVPSLPSIVFYTRDPTISTGTWCSYEISLNVAIFSHRANDRQGLEKAMATVDPMTRAVQKVNGIFDSEDSPVVMTYQPIIVAQVEYLAAVFPVTLYSE